jgi:outer membrane protein assembly factor BamB
VPRALLLSLVIAAAAVGLVGAALIGVGSDAALPGEPEADAAPPAPAEGPVQTPEDEVPETAPPPPRDPHPLVDRTSVGQPWGEGITTFRGNPTRTWYGRGPVPDAPEVAWRYPDQPMCTIEETSDGERRWCGTGWTGQPLVRVLDDGRAEVIVGAYDGAVHFVDGDSGAATRPPFRTGHMVKGTETLDPDGYPLLYTGSRDGHLRIVALDREVPTELWALGAHPERVWNNDWDGSPAIVDDVMYVGGEDSWFYAVELHRAYDADGLVTVEPEVILEVAGWTDELIAAIGDHNVSIESSVALFEGRAYFANSGGRIVGLDVSDLRASPDEAIVFDFWAGDDTDATITIDEEGMLYVAVELQRFLPRAEEVGQLIKLDPYTDGDPLVWSVEVAPDLRPWMDEDDGGIWATPALHRGVLYVTTHPGDLLAVDTVTGEVLHEERIGYHEWGSPVVVDDTLVVPTCEAGGLRAYDVSDPHRPRERWTFTLPTGACVESTPAVWDGRIYVGSRDGYLYGIGDR